MNFLNIKLFILKRTLNIFVYYYEDDEFSSFLLESIKPLYEFGIILYCDIQLRDLNYYIKIFILS
jgi:hypothetical protein